MSALSREQCAKLYASGNQDLRARALGAGCPPPEELTAEIEEAKQQGALIKSGIVTPTQTHNIFQLENLESMSLFWILMLYMAKHGEGGAVKEIILKMFDGAFTALHRYSTAAAANPVTAWAAGRLNSVVLERFGLISQQQAAGVQTGLDILSGFEVAEDFAQIVASVVPWRFGQAKPSDFPSTLTIGDTLYTVGAAKTTRVLTPKEVAVEKTEE